MIARSCAYFAAVLSLGAVSLVACGNADDSTNQDAVAREDGTKIQDVDSKQEVTLTRWARRLQIDRLQATIPRVAGKDIQGNPIVWKINGENALDDHVLGGILGRPNFVTTMGENPSPSSLYLKFMRDMARDVCTQMVTADVSRGEDATHTLWRFAPIDGTATDEQITKNLQYLLLRFLGMRVDGEHQLLVDFRGVFDAGISSTGLASTTPKSQAEGWRGVCIGLFESPLFHID